MSTKIFDGFRLADGAGPFDLLRDVRSVLHPWLMVRNFQELLDAAVAEFDNPASASKHKSFLSAWFAVVSAERAEKDPCLCNNIEAIVFENPVRGEFYVKFFASCGREVFSALPSVGEEFEYWNNSDRPPYVASDEEWKDRLVAWGEAFNLNNAPSNQGLSVTVLSDFELRGLFVSQVVPYLDRLVVPDVHSRAAAQARNLFMKEHVAFELSSGGVVDVGGTAHLMEAFHNAVNAWVGLPASERESWVQRAVPLVEGRIIDLQEFRDHR